MRVEKVVTSGTFNLDGGSWEVDNNVWLLGDDSQVLVIDAAHDAEAIATAVAGREVLAIACTHGHDDHVNAAPTLSERVDAPVLLHPADEVLWQLTHDEARPTDTLNDGDVLLVGGTEVHVLHTPGHAPGAVCFHVPDLGLVFTGDTLFQGDLARPAGRTRTSRRSSTRSGTSCSRSRPRRPSTPATATTRRSAPRRRTWRSGSRGGTEELSRSRGDGRRPYEWTVRTGSGTQLRWVLRDALAMFPS